MNAAQELLVKALKEQHPLILVLGQDAWRENGQEDPVLAKALAHLNGEDARQQGWLKLLADPLPSRFYEWLTERFERRVPPDWLSALGEMPWSAVFTSSLDPALKELFNKRQRPELVLTSAEMPPAIRSRVRPPIYHLFGHAGSPDPRARPPSDRSALNGRRVNDATPLLSRILDTATPLGLVVVDGVGVRRDWLRVDDLLGAISNAGHHQIIWFKGRSNPLPEDDDFTAAVDASRILVVEERLSTTVAHLRAVPQVADLLVPTPEEAGTVTFKGGASLEVSPEQRLYVEAVASIVDDAWSAPLAALGVDAKYAAFRQFHGVPGNRRSLVEGVRRGFAVKRDYEDDLIARVFEAINDHASVDAPIILHGQSATGKSIALARVVAAVRDAKDAAVLYATVRVPQPAELADYCHRAERAGAKATLIVCDTNQDDRPYVDLLSGLRSRGHRVVVLGSRYRIIDGEGDRPKTAIEAPTALSDREERDISGLLDEFADEHVPPGALSDHHILSFLYRALPLTRPRIGSGLSTEANRTVQMVREQRAQYMASHPPATTMAQRLIEAGADDVYPDLFDPKQRQAIESDDVAGRTIDLVMAAGSLDCPIPANLLWRLTANRPSTSLSPMIFFEVFGGLDLFRWDWADDEHSELLIGPRLTLEAELICTRRLDSPQKEADCIVELIRGVRSVGVDRDHERRFLLNVLRRIGPYGPRQSRYRSAYVRIGEALTELRTRFGVFDPSVVLQESAFRRHAVRENAVEEDTRRMTLLTEARDAIQAALDGVATGNVRASRRTQRFLKVELASLYGFIAYRRAETDHPNEEIWSTYLAARSAVRQAANASDSYYPIDVGLWTPSDLLRKGTMARWQRAELTADIYDILDHVDLDALGPEQRERFDVRRFKTADALGDQELSDAAFTDLIERDSAAGCYLRARKLAPEWDGHEETFSSTEREQARRAAEFLDEYMSLVIQDPRSLSLLLECRWICEVGRRPFVGQRQPLPASADVQDLILDVVTKLNEASGENPRNVTRYLAATLTWLGGGERAATEMFRALARDTDYEDASRVVRRHLIADQNGQAMGFDGRVEGEPRGGSCAVRLEGHTHQVVRLLERDFPQYNIAYGRQVLGFGVAFNFIGPIATPILGR